MRDVTDIGGGTLECHSKNRTLSHSLFYPRSGVKAPSSNENESLGTDQSQTRTIRSGVDDRLEQVLRLHDFRNELKCRHCKVVQTKVRGIILRGTWGEVVYSENNSNKGGITPRSLCKKDCTHEVKCRVLVTRLASGAGLGVTGFFSQ